MEDLEQLLNGLFDEVYDFNHSDGFYRVKKDGKFNFADESGKVVFDAWFDDADDIMFADVTFSDVERGGKHNMVIFDYKATPRLLSDTWYDTPLHFVEDCERIARTNGVWYVIDAENGKVIREATKDDLEGI